jgi:hypothetical protein
VPKDELLRKSWGVDMGISSKYGDKMVMKNWDSTSKAGGLNHQSPDVIG